MRRSATPGRPGCAGCQTRDWPFPPSQRHRAIPITHFTDQDHVGILPEYMFQAEAKVEESTANLPLIDEGQLFSCRTRWGPLYVMYVAGLGRIDVIMSAANVVGLAAAWRRSPARAHRWRRRLFQHLGQFRAARWWESLCPSSATPGLAGALIRRD